MYLPKSKIFDSHRFKERVAERGARDPTAVFRDTLTSSRERLREFHRHGASSQDVVHHHAWLVDQLLDQAWEHHGGLLDTECEIALVAVGGYGRGELHPNSDIDLMLLIGAGQHDRVRPFVEALLRFLWDIGLEVGHSVRTVDECVDEARTDLTVITNIMEARYLAGDRALVETMAAATSATELWPPEPFYRAKLREQEQRHSKFDDTAYNLEPNIKEGPGGLRDMQTVCWVMQRRYGVRDLKDLIAHGYLTEDEHRILIRGRNFLWKLRNGLHFIAKRREDRLLFDHQRALALEHGYQDTDDRLAVEQLMKRYYRTVKELRLLDEILLQHYEETNFSPPSAQIRGINRRFRVYNGYLETTHNRVFELTPFALLEMFLILEQDPELKGVRAGTVRQLRANLHRIDQDFRRDIRARSLFMEIMRQPQGVTHALRRMSAYGVLGAYIPAFGGVVGQMQHDLFHVYTVDAHSLFVVRNLRRLALTQDEDELPLPTQIMARLFKPERLYLAGFFHDLAKGRGGDHSKLGEAEAYAFCKSHDMSDYDAHFVAWLVRQHLLMSWTAQRQDISDYDVVAKFAQTVGYQERLDNLYLLTIADIRGTSPQVWNAWKGRLLQDLYIATSHVLRRGYGDPVRMEERVTEAKEAAAKYIDADRSAMDKIRSLWASLPDDYFLRHDAASIAWHVNQIAAAAAIDLPLVAIRHDPHLAANVFLIYAPQSEQLLSLVTGGFQQMDLNIADARIHTTSSGFALYTFVALASADSNSDEPRYTDKVAQRLHAQILDIRTPPTTRTFRVSRRLKHFPIETQVTFSDSANAQHTVMEVVAKDQPGLLHQVALCLLKCKVRLVTAKIATFGERAEDIFFVTDRDGNPLADAEQQDCLKTRIHQALDAPTEGEAPRAASL
ncbi:MAG: [protein-PII] uridylyltransferase [Gammaproteobacteria bacterium]|nr:[protein-PII] uridylyltransferase [Gammaproteobacteria bacterium]